MLCETSESTGGRSVGFFGMSRFRPNVYSLLVLVKVVSTAFGTVKNCLVVRDEVFLDSFRQVTTPRDDFSERIRGPEEFCNQQ